MNWVALFIAPFAATAALVFCSLLVRKRYPLTFVEVADEGSPTEVAKRTAETIAESVAEAIREARRTDKRPVPTKKFMDIGEDYVVRTEPIVEYTIDPAMAAITKGRNRRVRYGSKTKMRKG